MPMKERHREGDCNTYRNLYIAPDLLRTWKPETCRREPGWTDLQRGKTMDKHGGCESVGEAQTNKDPQTCDIHIDKLRQAQKQGLMTPRIVEEGLQSSRTKMMGSIHACANREWKHRSI